MLISLHKLHFPSFSDKYQRSRHDTATKLIVHTFRRFSKIYQSATVRYFPNHSTCVFHIILMSAKYAETSLKLLVASEEVKDSVGEKLLNDIYKVQAAHIKFLQEELAGVIVHSQFDANTSRLFKNLQRNTSVFDENNSVPICFTICCRVICCGFWL